MEEMPSMERAAVDAGGYLLHWLDAEVGGGDFSEKDAGVERLTFCFEMWDKSLWQWTGEKWSIKEYTPN